ncbi:MAG: hypothetical protein EB090_07025, partial [Verrucomicrobia bacterium]|nr:hypothetical protein [Verrucomicrobiota bacterium]
MNLIAGVVLLLFVISSASRAGITRDANGRISLSRENTAQAEPSTPLPAPAPEPKETIPLPT